VTRLFCFPSIGLLHPIPVILNTCPMKTPLTFIDLFCGCGGFSLGLTRAGLKGLAAIDFNPEAIGQTAVAI
jgi:tRNA/tmRNA/rRNA uracil-C5-methylase (TrmA/RlmC/RlmD family)